MNNLDLSPVWLTLRLALTTMVLLMLIATPIALWLSKTKSVLRIPINAIVALPLVLPPTVLGFYLLLLMGPEGPIGRLTDFLGMGRLPFTFSGLVVGSILYSLPFVVHPIQNALEAIGPGLSEAASTLRAGAIDRFFTITIPLAKSGFFTAAVLGFAHTIGEFGVVLMIGGNIPGRTKVLSVAIYDHVEAIEYQQAHWLAGGMLLVSFIILVLMYAKKRPLRLGV